MDVTFNHTIAGKLQTLRCESLSVYLSTAKWQKVVACVEFAGSATAVRACWASIVQGYNKDVEGTGVKIEVAGDVIELNVGRESKFTRKNISQNQLLVISKEFQAAKRTMILGGDYKTPSPFFSDMVRINLIQIPFKPEWIPQMWQSAIEATLIKPLIHYGAGPNAWEIRIDENDKTAHIDKWKKIVKEIVCPV